MNAKPTGGKAAGITSCLAGLIDSL